MKKITLVLLTAASLSLTSSAVLADKHTVSIGYAQSKVSDFKNIRGVNLQYRYEFDSPFSVTGSLTWMKENDVMNYYVTRDYVTNHIDVKYYSLLVGPAYRINNWVSLYALGGFAHTRANSKADFINYGDNALLHDNISKKSTSFAYGLGVMINPMQNVSVNIGYEGTHVDLQGNHSINGFNAGIGYRF